MTERWRTPGTFYCNGLLFRTVRGSKGPGDLRLDLRVDGEWVAVKMELGMMMADFFYENEERLYPMAMGNEGGFCYLNALSRAALGDGWEAEARRLKAQRQRGSLPAA